MIYNVHWFLFCIILFTCSCVQNNDSKRNESDHFTTGELKTFNRFRSLNAEARLAEGELLVKHLSVARQRLGSISANALSTSSLRSLLGEPDFVEIRSGRTELFYVVKANGLTKHLILIFINDIYLTSETMTSLVDVGLEVRGEVKPEEPSGAIESGQEPAAGTD